MEPLRDMGRVLLIAGLVLAIFGAVLMMGPRLPGRVGRLPGDIVYKRENFTLYFPIVTSILLSLALTLLLWLFGRR